MNRIHREVEAAARIAKREYMQAYRAANLDKAKAYAARAIEPATARSSTQQRATIGAFAQTAHARPMPDGSRKIPTTTRSAIGRILSGGAWVENITWRIARGRGWMYAPRENAKTPIDALYQKRNARPRRARQWHNASV
jgi:hypothetical protein